MAWNFGITAECGTDQDAANALVHYYWRELKQLPDDSIIRVFEDQEGNFWAHIYWENLSEESQDSIQLILEESVNTSPDFRYCLAGLETDEFRYYSTLLPDLGNVYFGGLIIHDKVYTEGGKPSGFIKIGEYYWKELPPTTP